MKKRLENFVSIFLVLIMVISIFPISTYASDVDNTKLNKERIDNAISEQDDVNSDTIIAEIKEERTENSKMFLMADGTYCEIISSKQLH